VALLFPAMDEEDLINEKTTGIYCVACEAEQNEGQCSHDLE